MKTLLRLMTMAVTVCACAGTRAAGVADLGSMASQTKIKPPAVSEVRQQALDWLSGRQADEKAVEAAKRLWGEDHTPPSLLDALAQTFGLADERAEALVSLCSQPRSPGPLPPQEWLKSDDVPAFERDNLRLFYGRWLAQEHYYDEALAQLEGLAPANVVDAAVLFFYQAVVHHRLLHKDEGLKALQSLLEKVDQVPNRYRAVATLMKSDLDGLKDESLDHISRQMQDVRRRLALGRAGKKVRKVEDDVIAALDKLIKEMEDRQQQQSQSSGGGAMPQPSQAMPDSRIAGMKGPGEVDRRRIGNSAGWGDLPPKQREAALQQIGKDFPPHYRDAIQQYFRKLAAETDEKGRR
jgi:hypothetical protein